MMKTPVLKARLVHVDWIDSHATTRWELTENIGAELRACQTAGFLIGQTKDAISIAGSVSDLGGESSQASGVMTIPRRAITKIRTLR